MPRRARGAAAGRIAQGSAAHSPPPMPRWEVLVTHDAGERSGSRGFTFASPTLNQAVRDCLADIEHAAPVAWADIHVRRLP